MKIRSIMCYRFFCLFTLLFTMLGCKKESATVHSVSFTQPTFFLKKSEPLEVKIYIDEPAPSDLTFRLEWGGSAVEGEDYVCENKEITIEKGATEGKLLISPVAAVVEQKDIKLELQSQHGYERGHHAVTFIPVEIQDILTCSFAQSNYEFSGYSPVNMLLYLGTRAYSRPGIDVYIPFDIAPESTAVLGEHYEIDSEIHALKLGAASASASVYIRTLKVEPGKDKIILRLSESKRFRPGLYNKTMVKLISKN